MNNFCYRKSYSNLRPTGMTARRRGTRFGPLKHILFSNSKLELSYARTYERTDERTHTHTQQCHCDALVLVPGLWGGLGFGSARKTVPGKTCWPTSHNIQALELDRDVFWLCGGKVTGVIGAPLGGNWDPPTYVPCRCTSPRTGTSARAAGALALEVLPNRARLFDTFWKG